MEIDWEDDWENTVIPDLLVSIQNKERELKLLEERKLVEEADLALSEELFNDKQTLTGIKQIAEPKVSVLGPKVIKKEKPKELIALQETRRRELEEKQKAESQRKKQQKEQQKKHKELYGEAEYDEYDEMYGHIEDQY